MSAGVLERVDKMPVKRKIEEIKASINRLIAIKDGIKIAEAASSKICLSPQQRQCATSVYDEKVLSAIVKVNNIDKKLNEIEESIKTKLDNIKRPEFSTPEFRHPLNFLEDLEIYFENMPVEFRTVENIIDCLQGDAKSWAIIFKERWSNIDDFKKDFLEQYWGRAEQSLLKREIVCGVWDSKHETLTQHFTSLVTQAKWLPRQIADEQLIFDIMRHFSKYVQNAWQVREQSTILEAIEFLKEMDKNMPSVLKSIENQITHTELTFQYNNNDVNDLIGGEQGNESKNIHHGKNGNQTIHILSKCLSVDTNVPSQTSTNLVVSNDAFVRLETQLENLTKHMVQNNRIHTTHNYKKKLRLKELKRLRQLKTKRAIKALMNSGGNNETTHRDVTALPV